MPLRGHVWNPWRGCWTGTNSSAHGGSGSVLSWLSMSVWWWLKVICFCQSTKLQTSLCVIDELVGVNWIKGGTLINEMLWHRDVQWLPALECLPAIGQIKFKKKNSSLCFPSLAVCSLLSLVELSICVSLYPTLLILHPVCSCLTHEHTHTQ